MKAIEGYEGIYSITRSGKVWSHERKGRLKGKWLNSQICGTGYYCVNLYKNNKPISHKIHRLVAQAYIPNIENKPEINHKNCNKNDNRVFNLEWCYHFENMEHAAKNGLFKVENIRNTKLSQEYVDEIRNNHLSKGIMKRKPWEKYNISDAHYYNVLNNKTRIKKKIGVII